MANASIYAAFERMWQHVVAALNNKSDIDHNHDDMYYTETEIDAMIENVGSGSGSITIDLEGSSSGEANTINADTLGGYAASEYVRKSEQPDNSDSLIKINYSVVGSLEKPPFPTNNTIWVNTDTEITGHIFSKNEPKNCADGFVWFTLGNTSAVAFNTLVVYEKEFDEVYPIAAKQYIGGSWLTKHCTIYLNNEWVDWVAFLYNYGLFYTEFDKWIFNSSAGTITENVDHIFLSRKAETNSQIGLWTREKINTTEYTKLYAEVSCSNVGVTNWPFYFGAFSDKVSTNSYSNTNMVAGTTFTANKIKTVYEVDITSINELVYIGIQGTGIAEVYKIWME